MIKDDDLDKGFPNRYETIVEVKTRTGKTFKEKNGIARGYPEAPMSDADVRAKFERLAGAIAKPARIKALADCDAGLWSARDVKTYAELMRAAPDA